MNTEPKILVIEDEATVMQAILMTLGHYGCTDVLVASDGREGVEIIKKHCPVLVITDDIMPLMDGPEVLGWIKRNHKPSHPEIRCLLLSADLETIMLLVEAAGWDAILPKPFSVEVFKEVVVGLLHQAAESIRMIQFN